MIRGAAGLLSIALLVGGCATSTRFRFDGEVSEGAERHPAKTSVDGRFEIDRGHGLLTCYHFDGLGILALVDIDSEPPPHPAVEAYLLTSNDPIDYSVIEKFAAADPDERARFAGAYPVRGTISVDRRTGGGNRIVRLEAEATDPKRTQFSGSLRPHLDVKWGWYGFGPM